MEVEKLQPLAMLRIVRHRQFVDAFVPYRVLIDNVQVGKVKSHSIADFPVDPGEHLVQLVGRRPAGEPPRSNALRVTVPVGAIFTVESHSTLSYFRSIAMMGLRGAPVAISICEQK